MFNTFDKALKSDNPEGIIFHSDRGFQYTGKNFKRKILEAKMIQSMSRVGRCIDNGPMESFWGLLKSEIFKGKNVFLKILTTQRRKLMNISNFLMKIEFH